MQACIRGRHLFEAGLYLTKYGMYPGDKGLENMPTSTIFIGEIKGHSTIACLNDNVTAMQKKQQCAKMTTSKVPIFWQNMFCIRIFSTLS